MPSSYQLYSGIYITLLENNYQTHVIVFFVPAKQEKCDQNKSWGKTWDWKET